VQDGHSDWTLPSLSDLGAFVGSISDPDYLWTSEWYNQNPGDDTNGDTISVSIVRLSDGRIENNKNKKGINTPWDATPWTFSGNSVDESNKFRCVRGGGVAGPGGGDDGDWTQTPGNLTTGEIVNINNNVIVGGDITATGQICDSGGTNCIGGGGGGGYKGIFLPLAGKTASCSYEAAENIFADAQVRADGMPQIRLRTTGANGFTTPWFNGVKMIIVNNYSQTSFLVGLNEDSFFALNVGNTWTLQNNPDKYPIRIQVTPTELTFVKNEGIALDPDPESGNDRVEQSCTEVWRPHGFQNNASGAIN